MLRSGVVLASILLAGSLRAQPVTFEGLSESDVPGIVDHGYVVRFDSLPARGVSLYSADGQLLYDTVLRVPGVAYGPDVMTHPVGVAVDTDGIMAVGYMTLPLEQGIAILDRTGTPLHFIETYPYQPSALCFAPDHSLWVFGIQHSNPETDYPVFRKYSKDGKELGRFVPRSSLPEWKGYGLDKTTGPVVGRWLLRASKDRLGALLSPDGLTRVWVELDFNGNLRNQWTYSGTGEYWFDAHAFTDEGILYGNRILEPHTHAGIVVFDKSSNTWKLVPSMPNQRLIGADGDHLVFRSGPDELTWSR